MAPKTGAEAAVSETRGVLFEAYWGGCKTVSNPTVTLSIIALRSVGQRTLRVPNIGHFRAIFGSQKGLSGLLNGSLALSVTVGNVFVTAISTPLRPSQFTEFELPPSRRILATSGV